VDGPGVWPPNAGAIVTELSCAALANTELPAPIAPVPNAPGVPGVVTAGADGKTGDGLKALVAADVEVGAGAGDASRGVTGETSIPPLPGVLSKTLVLEPIAPKPEVPLGWAKDANPEAAGFANEAKPPPLGVANWFDCGCNDEPNVKGCPNEDCPKEGCPNTGVKLDPNPPGAGVNADGLPLPDVEPKAPTLGFGANVLPNALPLDDPPNAPLPEEKFPNAPNPGCENGDDDEGAAEDDSCGDVELSGVGVPIAEGGFSTLGVIAISIGDTVSIGVVVVVLVWDFALGFIPGYEGCFELRTW